MRIRTWLIASVIATGALVLPAQAAQAAAKPFVAVVTCDAATNTITAGTAGGTGYYGGGSEFLPNQPVKVEFQTQRGSYVTASGVERGIYNTGAKTTVAATTGADGGLTMTGYTRAWPAADYVFYTETVKASVLNSQGQVITWREATCTYDTRTTIKLTCDRDARTIVKSASGVRYPGARDITIRYTTVTTHQADANSPRFTAWPGSVQTNKVRTAVNGDWSDPGRTQNVTSDPYYLSLDVQVEVLAAFVGNGSAGYNVIGKGAATCVYASPA